MMHAAAVQVETIWPWNGGRPTQHNPFKSEEGDYADMILSLK